MRKGLTVIVTLIVLSLTAAVPLQAQTRSRCTTTRRAQTRVYDPYRSDSSGSRVYRSEAYRNDNYRYGRYEDRSFWEEHRDKLTTAGGAAAGAVVGDLFAGKKGAIVGAIAGGGGAALYTYKIRDKHDRYRRY